MNDEDWGVAGKKSGMSRETKMGMTFVLLLLVVFGFVVYKKIDRRRAAREALLAQTEQEESSKTTPEDETVRPFAEDPFTAQNTPEGTTTTFGPPDQFEPVPQKTEPGFDPANGGATFAQTTPTESQSLDSFAPGNEFSPDPAATTTFPGATTAQTTEPAGPDPFTAANAITQDPQGPPEGNPLAAAPPTGTTFDPTAQPGVLTPASATEIVPPSAPDFSAAQSEPAVTAAEPPTQGDPFSSASFPGEAAASSSTAESSVTVEVTPPATDSAAAAFAPAATNDNAASAFAPPQQFTTNEPPPSEAFAQGGGAVPPPTEPVPPAAGDPFTKEEPFTANSEAPPSAAPPAPGGDPFNSVPPPATTQTEPSVRTLPKESFVTEPEVKQTAPAPTAVYEPERNGFPSTQTTSKQTNTLPPVGLPVEPSENFTGNKEQLYVVQPKENYWVISKKVYGTARYFSALARYNQGRIADPKKMKPGMRVLTPSREVLEAQNPDLFPQRTTQKGKAGVFYLATDGRPMYRVGSNDTLGSIAQRHLGRASRWNEIYQINRNRVTDPNRLKIGTDLTLPNDASRVSLAKP